MLILLEEDRNILIAGSIGSYGAALANGSEYSGNYTKDISHEVRYFITILFVGFTDSFYSKRLDYM